jgi:hypothetical protein
MPDEVVLHPLKLVDPLVEIPGIGVRILREQLLNISKFSDVLLRGIEPELLAPDCQHRLGPPSPLTIGLPPRKFATREASNAPGDSNDAVNRDRDQREEENDNCNRASAAHLLLLGLGYVLKASDATSRTPTHQETPVNWRSSMSPG